MTPAEDGSNGYVVSQQEDLSWTDFRTNVVNQIHISHGDNRVVRKQINFLFVMQREAELIPPLNIRSPAAMLR